MTEAHTSAVLPGARSDSRFPPSSGVGSSSRGELDASSRSAWRAAPWIQAMVAAAAVVGGLAYWDGQREAALALEDFGIEQASLAAAVSAELSLHLREVRRDARIVADGAATRTGLLPLANVYVATRVSTPGALAAAPSTATPASHLVLDVPVDGRTVSLELPLAALIGENARAQQQAGRKVVLLMPPALAGRALTTDGRVADVPAVVAALEGGRSSARLSRAEAASLGLPNRAAMAGLSTVESTMGRWGIAVVATAASERDREQRSVLRLLLSVLLAAGAVGGFAAIALRRQRTEMGLERDLALAQVRHRRDERLVRANRSATMGTLAMGIAHEISTPLGVIAGRAEQLLTRAGDERSERGLRAIADQASRIGEIVRGFLDLARGGRPTVSTVAPSEVVRGAVRLVEHKIAQGAVHLALDVPDDLPSIHCDVRLVEHAVVNLLLNACAACEPDGNIELRVRATGEAIAFVVNDDGVALADEDAARAAEPFFATKGSLDGAGVSLAIAHEIAKSHGGSLTLMAHAPRGTRATLQIPVRREDAPA